jgi:hypothetical protein
MMMEGVSTAALPTAPGQKMRYCRRLRDFTVTAVRVPKFRRKKARKWLTCKNLERCGHTLAEYRPCSHTILLGRLRKTRQSDQEWGVCTAADRHF